MSSQTISSSTASQSNISQSIGKKAPLFQIHTIHNVFEKKKKLYVKLSYVGNPKKNCIVPIDQLPSDDLFQEVMTWANEHASKFNDHAYWSMSLGARSKNNDDDGTLTDDDEEEKVPTDTMQINSYEKPHPIAVNKQALVENIEDSYQDPTSLASLELGDMLVVEVDALTADYQEVMELEDLEIHAQLAADWLAKAREVGNQGGDGIDYSTMVTQTKSDFVESTMKYTMKDFAKFPLYAQPKDRDYHVLFADPLWHPGKTNQNNNHCLIHALNSFLGGPIFDDIAKFVALYQSRGHMTITRRPEMIEEMGVSLKNLAYTYYNYHDSKWYSPDCVYTIASKTLQILASSKQASLADFINRNLKESRYVFQMVIISKARNKTNTLNDQFHAGAVVKHTDKKWYILDSAEDGPIAIEKGSPLVHAWLQDVVLLNFYRFIATTPDKKYEKALLKEWELIMNGKMAVRRQPGQRQGKSSRNYIRKDFRKKLIKVGSRLYRAPSSKTLEQKPRKDKAEQLLGKRNDAMKGMLEQVAKKEITEKARQQKKGQKELAQLLKDNSKEGPIKSQLQLAEEHFSQVFKYAGQIKAMKPLPTFAEAIEKLKSGNHNEQQVLLAWRLISLRSHDGMASPLAAIQREELVATNRDGFNALKADKQQQMLEQYVDEYVKRTRAILWEDLQDQYLDCPDIPKGMIYCYERSLGKENTSSYYKWYQEEIYTMLPKTINGEKPPKRSRDDQRAYDKLLMIVEDWGMKM